MAGVTNPDPWAWSLASVLTFSGVAVAALGSIASLVLAALALVQTKRANTFARADAEREKRAAVGNAAYRYLEAWPKLRVRNGQPDGILGWQAVREAAAAASPDAMSVATWILRTLNEAGLRERDLWPKDWSDPAERRMADLNAFGFTLKMRFRVSDWVATGVLDKSPLFGIQSEPPTESAAESESN